MACQLSARNLVASWLVFISCLYLAQATTTAAGPPPQSEFFCEFEISIFDAWCGVANDDTDDYDWNRQTSDNVDFTGPQPTVDHSTHLTHGHYLYAGTGLLSSGQLGRLIMPVFAQNAQSQCLEFFYQIGNVDAGTLNVYQWASSSSIPSPSWSMSDETMDVWVRGLLTIPPHTDDTYNVMFEALTGIAVKGFIAIDDVKISDGECPLANFTCTFEDDSCSFEQDRNDDEDWYRQQGATSSFDTGPSIDHTLGTSQGYYIYIEASFFSFGEKARIFSPSLQGVADGSSQACLEFFYHMFGATIGTLNVYVKGLNDVALGDPAWTLIGNRGDKWRGAEVDITLPDDFQIIFEGVRGESFDGDISLDDITFTRGAECPGQHKPPAGDQQGTCDFEEANLCEYTQDDTDDTDWLWQNSAGQYADAGPLKDHSEDSEFGFYLFLYGDVGHRKTARVTSPMVPTQSRHTCLEFWWYLYGNDDQVLNVYCVKDGAELADSFILSKSGNYGAYWRRTRHEIPPDLTPCRLVFEGQTGIHNRDDLAIDDVNVYLSEQCPQNPYFVNPTTTPQTTNNVNCDLENVNNPMCGWTQSATDGLDWTLSTGAELDYGNGLENDHTIGTVEGHYLLINTAQSVPANSRAELLSPLVSPTDTTRCFKFWYHMNSYNPDFLNVYVLSYGLTLPMDPIFQIFGNRGDMWNEGQVNLPPATRSFYIVVEGTVGESPYSADIAVDDFTMVNGQCPDADSTFYPFIANCDFEKDLCGYTQPVDVYSYDDQFDWFRNSGPTGTDGTGPSADHTYGNMSGNYMYIEASQPRRPGERALLISPMMNYFNDTYCLEFFYHMSGDDTASLVVVHRGDYYEDEELARLTGPVGEGWQPYNVDVGRRYGPVEIVFMGTVGNGYRADIGLDDITFTSGPCGGYPAQMSCNFEYGYQVCGMEQGTDDQLDWMWFDALVYSDSRWQGHGSYMYVDGFNVSAKQTAVLMSPIMTLSNNDHCLTFLYGLDEGMQLDVVSVGLDGKRTTLKSLSSDTSMTSIEYTIQGTDHPNNFRIHMIATTGDSKAGFAIVDNVYTYFGYCGEFTGGQPSTGSTTTVAVVLGVLLGVAALVSVALAVLYFRNKSASDTNYPAAVSYKNGGSDVKPDLSRDPGVDNPNYSTAPFSSSNA